MPNVLQHSLVKFDEQTALALCHHYSQLSYFEHALEILLHHVLDEEVEDRSKDSKRGSFSPERTPLLPTVISFVQAALPVRAYLDIVVQCTRKTELRSWQTLFTYLPPPKNLFEQALKLNSLKTAASYLLVLQAFDDEEEGHEIQVEDSVVRLMSLAARANEWDLCAELARFLMALDASGEMLRRAVARVGLRDNGAGLQSHSPNINGTGTSIKGLGLSLPLRNPSWAAPLSLSPSPSPSSPQPSDGITGLGASAQRESSQESRASNGRQIPSPPKDEPVE